MSSINFTPVEEELLKEPIVSLKTGGHSIWGTGNKTYKTAKEMIEANPEGKDDVLLYILELKTGKA